MWYDGSQNDEFKYSHISPHNKMYVYTHLATNIQVYSGIPPNNNPNTIYNASYIKIDPKVKNLITKIQSNK